MVCNNQQHRPLLLMLARRLSSIGIPVSPPNSFQMPLPPLPADFSCQPQVFPFRLITLAIALGSCRVDQAEDVVENVIATVGRQKLEGLSVAHWSPLLVHLSRSLSEDRRAKDTVISRSHQQCTAHNHQDASLRVAGLRVECSDLVLDLLEWQLL